MTPIMRCKVRLSSMVGMVTCTAALSRNKQRFTVEPRDTNARHMAMESEGGMDDVVLDLETD